MRPAKSLIQVKCENSTEQGATDNPKGIDRPTKVRRRYNALVEGFAGLCLADKGFIDSCRQPLLLDRYGIRSVTPARKNMTEAHPPALRKFCSRIRKLVETVGSRLTERFGIAAIRAHDLWHFQHCLIREVWAHTVLVFLNIQLKRDPSDLDAWPLPKRVEH